MTTPIKRDRFGKLKTRLGNLKTELGKGLSSSCLLSSLPQSYTPLVSLILRVATSFRTFPILFVNSEKLLTSRQSWIHAGIELISIFLEFLHTVTYAKWFYQVYYGEYAEVAYWKVVMTTYFFACACLVPIVRVFSSLRVQEVKELLELTFQLEKESRRRLHNLNMFNSPAKKIRLLPQLILILLLQSAIVLPSLVLVKAYLMPCMPPSIRMANNACTIWSGGDGSDFAANLTFALMEGFSMWGSVSGVVIFTAGLLVYPAAVVEMWMDYVGR